MISYACQTGAARNAGIITHKQAPRYIPRFQSLLKTIGLHPVAYEQALRLPVIFRKICFGNRSDEGAKSIGVILSLITTAKRQQRDPLAFLQTIIADGHEAAKPMLYRIPPELDDSS